MADVDVLLPIRNPRSNWLGEAIQSVNGQVDIDCRLIAVLHSDSASLEQHVRELTNSVVVIPAPPGGNLSDALNAGLAHCSAPYVARLDQDDIAEPMRLKLQCDELERDSTCAAIGSSALLIDESGNVTGARDVPTTETGVLRRMRWRNALIHSSVTYRSEYVRRIGGYSPAAVNVEDYELWLRMLQQGTIRAIGMPLIRYRVHSEQMTHQFTLSKSAANAVLASRRQLARARQESVAVAHARQLAWATRQRLW